MIIIIRTNLSHYNSYNQAESTTVQNENASANVTLLGAGYSGTVIRENCQLKMSNGTPWLYPNQTSTCHRNYFDLFSHDLQLSSLPVS